MHENAKRIWCREGHEAVESFDAFRQLLNEFLRARTGPAGDAERNRFLFRGQPTASDGLLPSVARPVILGKGKDEKLTTKDEQRLHQLETWSTDYFKSRIRLHVESRFLPPDETKPGISLEWWKLMQHHGAPTRLLDWTASPYVAAYFAAEKHPDTPGAVWIVEHGAFQDRMAEEFGQRPLQLLSQPPSDRERERLLSRLYFFPPERPNERMAAQAGWFSCAASLISTTQTQLALRSKTIAIATGVVNWS